MNSCQKNLYENILAKLDQRAESLAAVLAKHAPKSKRNWLLERDGQSPRPHESIPYASPLNPRETLEAFVLTINVTENKNDCWDYTGYCNPYGQTYVKRKIIRAHVLIQSLFSGLPENYGGRGVNSLTVRHKCDNPSCCNPHHLETGSVAENVEDKFTRGRATHFPWYGKMAMCKNCNKEFPHIWRGHKFCSRVCYKENIKNNKLEQG